MNHHKWMQIAPRSFVNSTPPLVHCCGPWFTARPARNENLSSVEKRDLAASVFGLQNGDGKCYFRVFPRVRAVI